MKKLKIKRNKKEKKNEKKKKNLKKKRNHNLDLNPLWGLAAPIWKLQFRGYFTQFKNKNDKYQQ